MPPLGLLDPYSALRVDRDAVRVIARGPVMPDFYDLVRDGVQKSRQLNLPLRLYFDGGEGLDTAELDAALSHYRLTLARGGTFPFYIHVVEGCFARILLPELTTPHILEIQPNLQEIRF